MLKNKRSAPQTRIHKALLYINDIDLFLAETDSAVPVLMGVFQEADADLKDEIIFLLGSLNQPEICMWLHTILADPAHPQDTRRSAAQQLSVSAAALENPDELRARLSADMNHPDPIVRGLAVLALGWEGNQRSAADFDRLTTDTDAFVRQAATAALSHITPNPLQLDPKEG